MDSGFLTQYLMAKADLNHVPIEGTFELTPLCNMRCKMCYIRHAPVDVNQSGGLLPINYWLNIADQALKNGTLFLLLTGGEPLLYPDFITLYNNLSVKGFVISINTNGTLITDDYIELFKKVPPRRINITLYGFSKETYKTLCDYEEGFEKTINAITKLRKNNINVCIHFVTVKDNVKDIPAVYEFAEKLDIPVEATSYVFPPVRYMRQFNDRLTPSEAGRCTYLFNCYRHGDDEFRKMCDAYNSSDNSLPNPQTARKMKCRAGISTYWITWNGKMLLCGMMPEPFIDTKTNSFTDCLDYLQKQHSSILLPEECGTCKNRDICQVCAAKVSAETGSFSTKPEYICETTEIMRQLMSGNQPEQSNGRK